MNDSEQLPDIKDKSAQPAGPPKAIGVYDRPERKKPPVGLIIALVVIVLLSLFVFWLGPTLF